MKRIFVVLSLLVTIFVFTGCTKYPQTLEEKTTHATVCERVYDENRDYYFIAVTGTDEEYELSFRTNKAFYEKVEVGQEMDITFRRLQFFDGEVSRYYWNEQELDNVFIQETQSDFQVEVVKVNERTRLVPCGRGFISRQVYDLTFRDEKGNERTAEGVKEALGDCLYEGKIVAFEKREYTAKLRLCDYGYYLNGELMFES